MQVRGINFGYVFNASGARNFFGNGWWYSWIFWLFGLRWEGSTFVTKSITGFFNKGNMLLWPGTTMPFWLLPRCIYVTLRSWIAGYTLNAVGLTCPGITAILAARKLQKMTQPFVFSIALIGKTQQEIDRELARIFVEINDARRKHPFQARFAVEVNISCPNVKGSQAEWDEKFAMANLVLTRMAAWCIPTIVKINALTPIEWVAAFEREQLCEAIAVSNALPYGSLAERIDWRRMFGKKSPLARFGGGGLSGRPLHPIVIDWIRAARAAGVTLPIIGGGGILSVKDAQEMFEAGADAISLGSISILRPWRVASIIRWVNAYKTVE